MTISAIRLTNCQSYDDVTFEFTKGLNVIRAENNTGKSAIFKMIKITVCPNYYKRSERDFLIRNNADYAEVRYQFDDGSLAMVRVVRGGRLLYYYLPNDSDETITTEEIPDQRILDRMSVMVDNENAYIANLLDLDQELLLVNSNKKSNENLINVLIQNKDLKRLTTIFKEKLPNLRERIRYVDGMKKGFESQLETTAYVDLDDLQDEIDDLTKLRNVLSKVYEVHKVGRKIDYTKDFDYEEWIEIVEYVKSLTELKLDGRTVPKEVTEYFIGLTEVLDKFGDDRVSSPNELEAMNKMLAICEQASKVDLDIREYKNDLSLINYVLELSKLKVDTDIKDYKREVESVDFLTKLSRVRYEWTKSNVDLINAQNEVKRLEKEREGIEDTMECPFCGELMKVNGEWIRCCD